jgi:integrase
MASLELRKTSNWWYGRVALNGRVTVHNLDVAVAGRRPSSLNVRGDAAFERSRTKAEAKLESLVQKTRERRQTEHLVQALHEAKTGHRIGSIPLDKLADRWKGLPRRATPSESHTQWATGVIARFEKFLLARKPAPREMGEVTHEMAVAFMAAELKRGVAGRTYNAELILLRGAFRRLRREAGMSENPFDDIMSRDEETIHRKPFTPEDLKAILDAAKDDAFCRPLLVTGMCTAMRRGDVCQLKWADVDLANRFITVKTSKTGATVQIPMFPMLHDELAPLPRTAAYCFPEAAELYQEKPDVIDARFRRIFRAAGFVDDTTDASPDSKPTPQDAKPTTPRLTDDEIRRRWEDRAHDLEQSRHTAKVRALMRQVFDLYLGGATVQAVGRQLKMTQGSVSHYLHRIEQWIGTPVVRRRAGDPVPAIVREPASVTRRKGLRRVNQHGFHAFRATWVTLALTAGVPVELVRKVTGHTVTETVLAHYFQPGREQFRQSLQTAMPKLLTDGTPSRDDQMREILRNTSARRWAADSKRLLDLLG